MSTRTKSRAGDAAQVVVVNGVRRNELRYRFAHLLTLEHFDQSLAEALVAHAKGQILSCDLRFVVEIVRAAERQGRAKIDSKQISSDVLKLTSSASFPQAMYRRGAAIGTRHSS